MNHKIASLAALDMAQASFSTVPGLTFSCSPATLVLPCTSRLQ